MSIINNQPRPAFSYDEVICQRAQMAAAQPAIQVVVGGNNAYEKLIGYMLIITNADGTPYTGDATVSMTTTTGVTMLPAQPYHCIRPSFMEKHEDRIIKVNDTKGFGQDFRFNVEASNLNAVLKIAVVCYFTRKK